jgi:hypothetical protein
VLGADDAGRRRLGRGGAGRRHGGAEEDKDSIGEGYATFTGGYNVSARLYGPVHAATNWDDGP